MKRLLGLLHRTALVLLFVNSGNCIAASIPPVNKWKAECIGLYQISVPGTVEETVTEKSAFTGRGTNGYALFRDGDGPGEAGFYVDGRIEVSPLLTQKEFQKYWKAYAFIVNNELALKINRDKDEQGFEEDWSEGASATRYKRGRVYDFESHFQTSLNEGIADAQRRRDAFLQAFTPRQLFEIPRQPGVCFPYGYLSGTSYQQIAVGVGMRLIDHPDVEIFFKHWSFAFDDWKAAQFRGSKGHVRNFWSFYGPTKGNKLDGYLMHYHSVKLGGYEGVYATVTIARPKESGEEDEIPYETQEQFSTRVKKEIQAGKYPLDYGYMAYFKGDYIQRGEPDLMLYVIRTAKRARDAGIEPVSKDDLYRMAKEIAASIKLKPVQ